MSWIGQRVLGNYTIKLEAFTPIVVLAFRNQPLKITATAPLGSAYIHELPLELKEVIHTLPDLSTKSSHPGEVVSIARGNRSDRTNWGKAYCYCLKFS